MDDIHFANEKGERFSLVRNVDGSHLTDENGHRTHCDTDTSFVEHDYKL